MKPIILRRTSFLFCFQVTPWLLLLSLTLYTGAASFLSTSSLVPSRLRSSICRNTHTTKNRFGRQGMTMDKATSWSTKTKECRRTSATVFMVQQQQQNEDTNGNEDKNDNDEDDKEFIIVRGNDNDDFFTDEQWDEIESSQPSQMMVMKELLGINIFTYILGGLIVIFMSANFFLGPGWLGSTLGIPGTGTFEEISDSIPDTIDLSNSEYLL